MYSKPFLYLILVASLAGTIACKKNDRPVPSPDPPAPPAPPAPPPPDDPKRTVYVFGNRGDGYVYWKNDTANVVPIPQYLDTYVKGMAVSGSHVYLCGGTINYLGRVQYSSAYLWTDSILTSWSNPGNTAETRAISVNGSDVYIAGTFFSYNGRVAVVWKNAVPTLLSDTTVILNDEATNILVSGTDVYVTGHALGHSGVYWKNSVLHKLDDSSMTPKTIGLSVSGSDLYIAGVEAPQNVPQRAVYWKNGKSVLLPTGPQGSQANAVVFAKDTVYVAGSINNTGTYVATLWKNGVLLNQPLSSVYSNANDIAIFGNDVYVAGTEYVDGKSYATVWKNGVAKHLGNPGGAAYRIIIQ